MKDAEQKDALYRHFRAQGWFALLEVPVFHEAGASESAKLITDIDVLALVPTSGLTWRRIVGDCKTRKGESPANRALWVRGLMDYVGGDQGVCVLRNKGGRIEPDHKLVASSLGVMLLEEAEFQTFDRAIVHPAGSSSFPESGGRIVQELASLAERFPRLRPLLDCIRGTLWNESDLLAHLRLVTAAGRRVRNEVDPGRQDHLAMILEASAAFSVGMAECVGRVFHQYLHPSDRATLEDALRVLIWGGRSNYDTISRFRNTIVNLRGHDPSEAGALELPEWQRFVQLVRQHLEAPTLSFAVPGVLLSEASCMLFPDLQPRAAVDTMTLRFAMMNVAYFCHACGFPADAASVLKQHFLRRIDAAMGDAGTDRERVPAGS